MTLYLVSRDNPQGLKTEEILFALRADLLERMVSYRSDPRREMKAVLANNIRILGLLTEAMVLAEENTRIIDQG
ncbi:histidine kinase [Oleisolibacter albus]|uniref:histidine kinase n=1 Tax=Oleisolibacter albus TaxID=2171757 RepID=UPI000DF246F7|nr:histidine kinase [Oleisolibacter albus]